MIENLIHFTFKYKLLVLILFIGVFVAGIYSLLNLPIDAFPDVSPNLVQVFAESEGMAAEEVEQFISRPVEIAMMGITGVDKIRSISSHGLSTVNIYFKEDVDIYFAHQQVAERLAAAEEGIPENVHLPHGIEKGPVVSGMGKVLAYYVDGEGYSTTDLRTIQDWVVKRELQTVPGVAEVLSQGGHVRQYQVRVDPDRLLQYDLTIDDVVDAVQRNNANLGAGIIERGSEELMVRVLGLIKSIPDIENIVLKTHAGNPIYVRDVADVEFGEAFRRGVVSIDGEKEVAIGGAYKLHGANSFAVIERVKERIDLINQTLPEGVKIIPFYDQSKLVRNSIITIRSALTLGLVLVCIVAFVFLANIRNALVMVFSLPFSVLLTLAMMDHFDIPGDLISFGGVAIAMGMIIDATIIMVEKIQSSLQESGPDRSATQVIIETAREVGRPIFFAIAIIIIVFLPIFTLQNVEGKMFRPLAFTVTVTMAGSLIYALFVAPLFYSILHRERGAEKKGHPMLSWFQNRYRRILAVSLRRTSLVALCTVLLMVLGVFVFSQLGKEFVPTLQEGAIQILAHMNPNISLEEISRISTQIEKDIRENPEVENVITEIGYGEIGPHVHHTNYACITVTLHPRDQWKTVETQEQLIARIDQRLSTYPGVAISYSQPVQHEVDALVAGAGTQVVAKVFGSDFDVLKQKAAEIQAVLSDIRGVADLRTEQFTGQTQVQLIMKRQQLARHGLNSFDVQSTVRNAVGGQIVGSILEGEKSFGINVRFDKPYREDIDAIGNLLVRTPTDYTVPLKELSDIQTITGLRQVSRENSRRFVSVQCNVRGRDAGGFVEEAQAKISDAVSLPPGYSVVWGGQFELQQAANRRLIIIVPLTLLLILIMLYGLFDSVPNVLLIMLNIPLALVGGVFLLAVFGANVSIPSSIGFIALFGIALTDGLVLISRFEYLRNNGMSLEQAVTEGSVSKLRPVLMTTLTTAFGLVPLILSTGVGSEVQRPLAIVVVGGLSSSTILTLIVLPALYLELSRRLDARRAKALAS
mgnify:CR=1 FL=1